MVTTAALYQTRLSVASPPSGTWTQILAADPRRWYLEFRDGGSGTSGPGPVPAPVPNTLATDATVVWPYIIKFRDAPNIIGGAWFVNTPPGQKYLIIEQLYVG